MDRDFAKDHLTLVLSFFPRVDSAIALLVGIEIAMLGYLAAKLPSPASPPGLDWLTTVGMLMSVGLLGASFVMLYRTAFPILAGGQGSIIYFRAIAGRSASEFAAAYAAADEALVRADLTEQIWRNSVILRQKYDRLKRAYLLLAASVLPWAFTVWRVTRIS